jgi:phage terminase large subunit-like protein
MLSDSTQRSFIEVAEKFGLWNPKGYLVTANRAILNNKVEVLFRSADDPDVNRGPSLYYAWLDEAGLMKEAMLGVMIGRLRGGGHLGRLAATFTPQGKEHWTYRLFADPTNPLVELFKSKTRDNPFVDEEYYQALLLQYGKGEGGILRAAQELDGDFVCVEGAEWPPTWFDEHVWFDHWPDDNEAPRAVMLDSSKGSTVKPGDYSCFALAMYSQGKIWMEFNMDNTRNTSEMVLEAIRIQKTFNPHWFGVESEFGGSVLVDDLANRADAENIIMPLVLVPTGLVQKEARIRRLTPYLARDMIRFRRTEGTRIGVTQFESFPHAEHDDSPDSGEAVIRILNESGSV